MSLKNLLSIYWGLATLVQPLAALNPGTRLSQYGHTIWRVQDGALSGNPTAFAQTPDGYIWIGTPSGLYRFDGVTFLAWSPPPGERYPSGIASVKSLHAAKDGSLWIGLERGLSRWKDGKFTSVSAPGATVEAISEDGDGAIWITRSHMLNFSGPICRVSADIERCYGESERIKTEAASQIAIDAKRRFWIGGSGS